jgi:hypothetical protein
MVDDTGTPIRIQGEACWDAHINLDLGELRAYLDDRQAKGFNSLFTYIANPIAYFAGSSAPWAKQLGGKPAGVAALPFIKNAAGGTWDGDPQFVNHDANFAYPNDTYFAWVAQFVDEAAAHGMYVMLAPLYLGYDLGANDGWYKTMMNSANTQSVCYAFGQYLANGHGAFTGFKNRSNIVWVEGGDTLPPNGSEGALRALQVLKGMQFAGDTHIQTAHWQHDSLTNDQADFATYLTAYAAYTHGPYGSLVIGPTYAESRALYNESTRRPTWLLETTYWGEHGATRAQNRYFHWAAALSTITGETFGFGPFWGFTTSADGTTATPVTATTAWVANTNYTLNQYVSKGGNWYRATTAGKSSTSGPSGTGSSIADGSVIWAYVATGGWNALLNEPGLLDFQLMGTFLQYMAWCTLIPSGLGGMQTLITAGGGSYASWSDGNGENGGMDWVVSAAAADGTILVAYVPDAHTGSLTVAMSAMSGNTRARWFDPTNGTYVSDPSGIGYVLSNIGTHAFTTPRTNAAGANDWALMLDTAAAH